MSFSRPLLAWCIAFLVTGTLLRAALIQATPTDISATWLFVAGFWSDLQALAVTTLPIVVFSWIGTRVMRFAMFVALAVLLIFTIAELFFWYEFESRLDRLVFHYLAYPVEVISFLEDQFYLSLVIVPLALALAIIYWPFRRVAPIAPLPAIVLATLGVAVVAFGKPIFLGGDRWANQIASNGYLGILTAARVDVANWRGHYPAATSPAPPGSKRKRSPPLSHTPRHVILVIEESFAGATWTQPELRAKYLPELSQLIPKSLYFSEIYATGSRTTRGLEAILNGFPPLPGIAAVERDGVDRLPSLPRTMAQNGFYTTFVYGGWPDFSNLSTYWRAIGFEDVYDRYDFSEPAFETSWGVADELLFEKIITVMNAEVAQRERVFLATLTVTHHRPYDFPAGRVPHAADERSSAHAMAYADWALGRFLENAAREPWFNETLFVIVADHGARIEGRPLIPVSSYRVPLLLYAPDLIEPRNIDHLGSTMSLAPTLVDLLGLTDSETFFGSSLLLSGGVAPVEHDYHVGLIDDQGLTVLPRDQAPLAWERHEDGTLTPAPADPRTVARTAHLFERAHAHLYPID